MNDRVHIAEPAAFVAAAAQHVATKIESTVADRGTCRLALAGGSTPRPVYEALAERTDLPWAKVEFLFGDERLVGPDDPSSNFRMVHDTLLHPLGIEDDRVARIRGEHPPLHARADYEARLGDRPLDIALLGMGGDGHTASLFPGSDGSGGSDGSDGSDGPDGPDGSDTTNRVVVTTSPIAPHPRISLAYRTFAQAHHVVFLVAGEGKAARLAQVFAERTTAHPTLPAAKIRSRSGPVSWLLDHAAASALPRNKEDLDE